MNSDWLQDNNNYLIYIGDAMCSWCHGFSPELDQLILGYSEFNLKLVMGGLRPFSTERAIDMSDFLKSHWIEINQRTNQPFSFEILENEDFIYDTEPASRAIIVARTMNPLAEYDFFKALQMAFYRDNHNTNKLETYLLIAAKFDFDLTTFEELFNSAEIKTRTKADFQISQQMGIKGFPSVLLKYNGKLTQVSNGYSEFVNIDAIIKKVLSKNI